MTTLNRNRNLKRGGFVAPYSQASANNDYILYNHPTTTESTSAASNINNLLPGMKGGRGRRSTDGGCPTCGKTGGNKKKGGFGLELAPFMSALALLGARLLADKEIGIFNDKKEKSLSVKKTVSRKKS
jgi:hypothetical protein